MGSQLCNNQLCEPLITFKLNTEAMHKLMKCSAKSAKENNMSETG